VVQLALGMDTQRGDNLSISQTQFFEHPYAQSANYLQDQPRSWTNMIRWVIIALTFGVVVFLVNNLRKKVSTGSMMMPSGSPAMQTRSTYQHNSNELGGLPNVNALPSQDTSLSPELEQLTAEPISSSKNKELLKKKDDVKDFFELKPMQAADIVRVMFDTSLISKL